MNGPENSLVNSAKDREGRNTQLLAGRRKSLFQRKTFVLSERARQFFISGRLSPELHEIYFLAGDRDKEQKARTRNPRKGNAKDKFIGVKRGKIKAR